MHKTTISTTHQKQVIDITEMVEDILAKIKADTGVCHLFTPHSSCSITTTNLDPGTDQDLLEAVARMFPPGSYRHPHDPAHVGDHIMSSFIGASLTIPVESGRLILGTWQRVALVELCGPRTRHMILSFIPEK